MEVRKTRPQLKRSYWKTASTLGIFCAKYFNGDSPYLHERRPLPQVEPTIEYDLVNVANETFAYLHVIKHAMKA